MGRERRKRKEEKENKGFFFVWLVMGVFVFSFVLRFLRLLRAAEAKGILKSSHRETFHCQGKDEGKEGKFQTILLETNRFFFLFSFHSLLPSFSHLFPSMNTFPTSNPRCICPGQPLSVKRQVGKEGPNKGRFFYNVSSSPPSLVLHSPPHHIFHRHTVSSAAVQLFQVD